MTQSICLNMIVKNEAKAILRCLKSVRPLISSWVIVDTGSTDGTQSIINEYLKDIPGALHERPWRNFGHNRTEAIQLAAQQGDFLLFMDADDFMQIPEGFSLPELRSDAYYIAIEDNGLVYERHALVRQGLGWRYVGVLHEYLHSDQPFRSEHLAGPKIIRNLGGTGLSETELIQKYAAHAKIFEDALRTEPANARYVFYLAQSYRDSRQFTLALETYLKRSRMGGWEEELWFAKYEAARLSERLGLASDLVTRRYLEAFEARPSRAEPLVDLAKYYRLKKQYVLAQLYAARAAGIPRPDDILFVDSDAYEWRAADELAVASYWTGDFAQSAEICRRLISSPKLPASERDRIAANLQFALAKIEGRSTTPLVPARPAAFQQSEGPSLEALLGFSGTIEVADIGAAFITEIPPYDVLLKRDLAVLNAFDADHRQHEAIIRAHQGKVRIYPDIVGDGGKATLHLASEQSGMSSLLEPNPQNLAFFNGFSSFGAIHNRMEVDTIKLDEIAGLPSIDFLKMDIQGSELPVLRSGLDKLSQAVAIQLEISFVPLYRNQPCFGEIDVWMRQNKFVPHTMLDLKRWSVAPLIRQDNFRVPFNQVLEGDIVYFRDCIATTSLSDAQLNKLILVAHYCYASFDLVAHLLAKRVERGTIAHDAVSRYVQLLKAQGIADVSLSKFG